ncbi:hypothetical protein [Georgenia muralis]|uniref:hypothetical protein n=1 Tax=Georgenia muralis TaxID=154117 RepID=UPI000F4FC3CA|nr:hypothetical protein [Georgenia muralis]
MSAAAEPNAAATEALRARLRLLGTTFAVECPDEEFRRELERAWSRCIVDEPSSSDDGDVDFPLSEVGEAGVAGLLMRLTPRAIHHAVGQRLMVHAAGLVDDRGRVVALVGRSGAGKTTAAVTLAKHNFGYVTDETVGVGESRQIAPFPRPLAQVDRATGRKVQTSPDELGLRRAPADLTLDRIVLLDRDTEPRPASVESVPLLDGLMEIIPQTSGLVGLDRPLQRLCAVSQECGGLRRLSFHQIDDGVADLLRAVLTEPVADTEDWQPVADPVSDEPDISTGFLDGRVRRRHHRDAVRIDGEILLLVGSAPVRISGIGLTVWLESHEAPTIEQLVEAAVATHGPHPHAADLVREAVATMAEAEVVAYGLPRAARDLLGPLSDTEARPGARAAR